MRTRDLRTKQDQHRGDRWRLFTAVAEVVEADNVLYPGSYVDIAPSFVWPSVTYVDVDRRAERFFDDDAEVRAIIAEHDSARAGGEVSFVAGDLPLREGLLRIALPRIGQSVHHTVHSVHER